MNVLFLPDYPDKEFYTIVSIFMRLGYFATRDPDDPHDFAMSWQDATWQEPNPTLELLARTLPVVNLRCRDISKRRVESAFSSVFGYSSFIDPAVTHGKGVKKFDRNASGGYVIELPVEPGENGYITVTEAARFSGYQAAEMRGQLRDIETSEMQASLQRWIGTRYSDAELTEYAVENVFDAGYDLLVEIQYTLPLETDGTFDVPGFLEAYYLEFDRIADRRFPFEHYFPLRVSAVTSVRVPAGMRLEELAKRPDAGESRFGLWNRKVTQDDDRWQIEFDYVASDKRFAPEDYREFAEFQRKAVDAIEQPLILQ